MSWQTLLKKIAPRGKGYILDGLAATMPQLISEFEINTGLRQAHFFAQVAHESAGFQTTVEYASGEAYDTGRLAIRLGNTPEDDNDGRKFKGMGLIQLTGQTNQRRAATELGILEKWLADPKILAEFPAAALTSGLYWRWRNLNAFADADDIKTITKRINGGFNGLEDRKHYLVKAKNAIAENDAKNKEA